MAIKYLNLDGEFEGYTLYYHDPVLPDGPNWMLEDECGLVCDDEWIYVIWEPGKSDEEVEYFKRLAAHCDDCFNKRLGQVCDDPEYAMSAEVSRLARTLGWTREEEKVAG